jgi:hypothetical protein
MATEERRHRNRVRAAWARLQSLEAKTHLLYLQLGLVLERFETDLEPEEMGRLGRACKGLQKSKYRLRRVLDDINLQLQRPRASKFNGAHSIERKVREK